MEDIWATLDENIQSTAQKIKSKVESQNIHKVSVGAGTSTKRETLEKSKASPTQLQNTFLQVSAKERMIKEKKIFFKIILLDTR